MVDSNGVFSDLSIYCIEHYYEKLKNETFHQSVE